MRFLTSLIVAVFLFALPLEAQETPTFSEAYKAYNSAVEVGDFEAALPHARAAYELGVAKFGEGSREHAVFAYNLGRAEGQVNGVKEAEPYLRQSIKVFEKVSGKKSIELLDPLLELGELFGKSGNRYTRTNGIDVYRRALRIIDKEFGPEELIYAQTALSMGTLVASSGRRDDIPSTIRILKSLREAIAEKIGEQSLQGAVTNVTIGRVYLARGNYRNAQKAFELALPVLSDSGSDFAKLLVSVHSNLVMVYDRLGNDEKASEHCVLLAFQLPKRTDIAYQPIFKEQPSYPRRALQRGKSGHVLLEFTITPEGRVIDASVVETNETGLFEDAALEALEKQWYAPQIVNGQPVATTGVRNLFTFEFVN